MKHLAWVFYLATLCLLLVPASGLGRPDKGWTRAEAASKVGKRVQYDGGSNHALLQWGPVRKGGMRTVQKPLGRGVKAGATGMVTGIVKDGPRGYEVIVEWDPNPEKNEVWESGLYKDNYGLVIEIPR